jgi:hypothetical protein
MSNTNQQIEPVLALREQLRLKRNKLAEKLAEVDKELDSANVIIRLLGYKDVEPEAIGLAPKELSGMTQMDAILHLAKKNNNRIKIIVAKQLLSSAGMLNGAKKNHYNILSTIIKRSELFEHVGPGEFELKQKEEKTVQMRKMVS